MLTQYAYFITAPLEEGDGYRLGQMFFQSFRAYKCLGESDEKRVWLGKIKARTLDSDEASTKYFESQRLLTSMYWTTRIGFGIDCNYEVGLDEDSFAKAIEAAFEFDVCNHIKEAADSPEEPMTKMDIQSCEDSKVIGY